MDIFHLDTGRICTRKYMQENKHITQNPAAQIYIEIIVSSFLKISCSGGNWQYHKYCFQKMLNSLLFSISNLNKHLQFVEQQQFQNLH